MDWVLPHVISLFLFFVFLFFRLNEEVGDRNEPEWIDLDRLRVNSENISEADAHAHRHYAIRLERLVFSNFRLVIWKSLFSDVDAREGCMRQIKRPRLNFSFCALRFYEAHTQTHTQIHTHTRDAHAYAHTHTNTNRDTSQHTCSHAHTETRIVLIYN